MREENLIFLKKNLKQRTQRFYDYVRYLCAARGVFEYHTNLFQLHYPYGLPVQDLRTTCMELWEFSTIEFTFQVFKSESFLQKTKKMVTTTTQWACPTCTLNNKATSAVCEMCESPKPNFVEQPDKNVQEIKQEEIAPVEAPASQEELEKPTEWACAVCTLLNKIDVQNCEVCYSPAPEQVSGQVLAQVAVEQEEVTPAVAAIAVFEAPQEQVKSPVESPVAVAAVASAQAEVDVLPEVNEIEIEQVAVAEVEVLAEVKEEVSIADVGAGDVAVDEAPKAEADIFTSAFSFLSTLQIAAQPLVVRAAADLTAAASSISKDLYRQVEHVQDQDGKITLESVQTKAAVVAAEIQAAFTKEKVGEMACQVSADVRKSASDVYTAASQVKASDIQNQAAVLTTKFTESIKKVGQWRSLDGRLSKKDVDKIEKGLGEMKEVSPEKKESMQHVDLIALATSLAHNGYEKAKPLFDSIGQAALAVRESAQPACEQAGSKILQMSQPVLDQAKAAASAAAPTINSSVQQALTKTRELSQPVVDQATVAMTQAKPMLDTIGGYATSAQPACQRAVDQAGVRVLAVGQGVSKLVHDLHTQPEEVINKEKLEALVKSAIEFEEKTIAFVQTSVQSVEAKKKLSEAAEKVLASFQKLRAEQQLDLGVLTAGVDHLVAAVSSFLAQFSSSSLSASSSSAVCEKKTEVAAEEVEAQEQCEPTLTQEYQLEAEEVHAQKAVEQEQEKQPEPEPEVQPVKATVEAKVEQVQQQIEVKEELVDLLINMEADMNEGKAVKDADDWEQVKEWEVSKWEMVPCEFVSQMFALKEMGYNDVELLVQLLQKCKGDVTAVCAAIADMK